MGLFSRKKTSEQRSPEVNDESQFSSPFTPQNKSYLNTFENDSGAAPPGSGTFGFGHDTPAGKEQFWATDASRSSIGSASEEKGKKPKKSLYQKYQDLKRGPGLEGMSDEEFKKAMGMTRQEHAEWAKGATGVGGNQAAGSLTAGGTSGIGVAAGAEQGLGGWGWEAGKDPVVK